MKNNISPFFVSITASFKYSELHHDNNIFNNVSLCEKKNLNHNQMTTGACLAVTPTVTAVVSKRAKV